MLTLRDLPDPVFGDNEALNRDVQLPRPKQHAGKSDVVDDNVAFRHGVRVGASTGPGCLLPGHPALGIVDEIESESVVV